MGLLDQIGVEPDQVGDKLIGDFLHFVISVPLPSTMLSVHDVKDLFRPLLVMFSAKWAALSGGSVSTTKPRMKIRNACRVSLLVGILVSPFICHGAGISTPFQGTFSRVVVEDKGRPSEGAWILEYRLKQVENRVCGEWLYETPTRVQEGLLVGKITRNVLTLVECPDQESICTFANYDDSKSDRGRYKVSASRLERISGNGDGSNTVYSRVESTEPSWRTYEARDSAEFLKACR